MLKISEKLINLSKTTVNRNVVLQKYCRSLSAVEVPSKKGKTRFKPL